MSLRIMIVEDEPIISEEIAATVEDLGYVVASKVLHAKDATNVFHSCNPDLVLMDINLGPGKDGIQLATDFKAEKNIPLIFLTSYSDKSIIDRAKTVNPDGYIVKPFDEKDLQVAIEIAFHRFEQQQLKTTVAEKTDSFLINKHLFVRHKNKLIKLCPEDVLYAEAQSNYTVIVTDKEKYTVSTTLGIIEERLVPFGFLRIHRSYIINLSKIETIEDDNVSIGKQAIPLSRNNKQELLNKITQL
ncbi:MAG TPA: response regulator [Chitinophagaceae bacterium]|nr:response regulator [Chitinophagaceae bacterium]